MCTCFQQFGNHRLQLAVRFGRVHLALGINNEDGRDRIDTAGCGELARPTVSLVTLRPGNVLLFDELFETLQSAGLFRLVEADAVNSTP